MSTREEKEHIELLQGTLDLLILRSLLFRPAHGHAIAKAIEFRSDEVLQVQQGSLCPALHRLIKRGWISAEKGTLRRQPVCQVLSPYGKESEAAGGGEQQVGKIRRSDRANSAVH
jgi:DNA-binding PadR family transcriptional regulator